jgi:3-hydroxyacyl-CoA dehydrogenase/enoyl-CoA hydratase/3-hydroxybutyryl-CoA epimerase
MERADAKVLAKHWRWEKDKDGLAWLTFDKQGESANTFSKERCTSCRRCLARSEKLAARHDHPLGQGELHRRRRRRGIHALQGPEDALAFTRLGWDTFQQLADLPFPTTAMVNGFCMGGGSRAGARLQVPSSRSTIPRPASPSPR